MLRALIADRLPDRPPRRIILSDENMLGPGFRTDGFGLYPYAYPRLAALRRLLGRPPSAVHLTLRAYDTFLVSVYAMAAVYRRDVPPFDDIRETLLAVHRGWPDVVDDVARVFPGTALKLTRVERDSMENRVRGLVGPELLKRFRFDGDERPNAAPTAEAMAAAAGSEGRTSPDDLVARSHVARRPVRSADRGRTLETCAALRDGPGVSGPRRVRDRILIRPAMPRRRPGQQAGDRCRGLHRPQRAAGQRRRAHRLSTIARIAGMRSSWTCSSG